MAKRKDKEADALDAELDREAQRLADAPIRPEVDRDIRAMKLYHFTDPANLPSIRKHGLTPHPLFAFPGHERERAVWLNSEPVNSADCNQTAMLTVSIDLTDLRLCSDLDDDPIATWFLYRGVIPPDKIEGL